MADLHPNTQGASNGLATEALRRVLVHAGEDPDREGLRQTPERYLRFLDEFLSPEPFEMTIFDGESYDQMILQTDIPFYSLCEHHLLPFFGTASIAYVPDGRIVGLSKLARTLEQFSRRLQNQERITQQTAVYLHEQLTTKGVAVVLKARHLCMEMRGVRKPGSTTVTSHLIGCFMDNEAARAELMMLLR